MCSTVQFREQIQRDLDRLARRKSGGQRSGIVIFQPFFDPLFSLKFEGKALLKDGLPVGISKAAFRRSWLQMVVYSFSFFWYSHSGLEPYSKRAHNGHT